MEPMNKFLSAATPDFKRFIDEICSWDSTQDSHHEPQYQAAFQVKPRLPPMSREGLPTLPFLLDSAKSMAALTDIWLDNAPSNIVETGVDEYVRKFHRLCLALRQRTQDCMAMAEAAQEPNDALEGQWQRMLNEQPRSRLTLNPFEMATGDQDITALPQTPDLSQVPPYHPMRRSNTEVLSPTEQRHYDSTRRTTHRIVTDPRTEL